MFSKLGLMDAYNLDPDKVSNFFAEVGRGYHRDVPYHNEAHAASVLHFTFALMTHGGVAAAMNQQIDFHMSCLAALVAAAIHDYDHLGVNNQYLEVTNHDRAACGAQHVNEQHHLVCGLAVLNMPGCNFLNILVLPKDFSLKNWSLRWSWERTQLMIVTGASNFKKC